MTRSVAIIGAGQIGLAASTICAGSDWRSTVYARSAPAARFPEPQRFARYETGAADAPRADLVIDTIAFDECDVARYDPDTVGRLVVISSASVYRDEAGRTFDEAAAKGFPEFRDPITEDTPTVSPGPESYSTRKVRMENKAIERFGDRATILRPCAIHGRWSRAPREWWFVKRILDNRERIPLQHNGASRFHTTSAGSIAGMALDAADRSLGGVFNVADRDAPSVLEIGRKISTWLEHPVEFVPVPSSADKEVGRTPWSIPKPFILSGEKQDRLSSEMREPYANDAVEAVEWLREYNPKDWRLAFPKLAEYPWDLFNYDAEDRFFTSL